MFQHHQTQEETGATNGESSARLAGGIASERIDAWLQEAEEYTRKGIAPEAANTLRRCAGEIGAALQAEGQRKLTLTEAAEESNYSVDHLGRMIRRGDIPNIGREGKPAIRRRDLPRRGRLVQATPSTYDVKADARSLRVRGRRN